MFHAIGARMFSLYSAGRSLARSLRLSQFFFDKKASKLYLYYNGTGAPPADTTFIAPQIPTLVNISGSQAAPVKDFTVDGLRFTGARYTYMYPHGVPSAGDWALDRIGAIFIEGSTGTKFSNCGFERLDGVSEVAYGKAVCGGAGWMGRYVCDGSVCALARVLTSLARSQIIKFAKSTQS